MSGHIALHRELLSALQNAPIGEMVHLVFLVRLLDLGGNREIRSIAENAFHRFCSLAGKGLREMGGRVLCLGSGASTLIGPHDEHWDYVHIIECPDLPGLSAYVADLDRGEAASLWKDAVSDARLLYMRPTETW